MIHTAETRFVGTIENLRQRGIDVQGHEAELVFHAFWHQHGVAPVVPSTIGGRPLPAFVNAGRWLVQCECGGAQIASRTDHRFFCADCLNSASQGRWRAVVWPDNADAIEHALDRRPDDETRGWNVGQTIAELELENNTHGIA